MNLIKSFIGYELPSNILVELSKIQAEFKKDYPEIRLIRMQNLHLTLAFLGNIDTTKIKSIKNIVTEQGTGIPVLCRMKSFLLLPHIQPRIAAVSISAGGLDKIYQSLKEGLKLIGIKPDARQFLAHITFGRFKKCIPEINTEMLPLSDIKFELSKLNLYKSTFTSAGVSYDVL